MGSKRRRHASAAHLDRQNRQLAWTSGSRRNAAVVFIVAALVRLLVVASIHDLPLVRTPKLDAFEYVSWARRMADGNFTWPAISAHSPGYPLFVAVLFALGFGVTGLLVVQALVGALTATFVETIGSRWFGPRAGLYAGVAYALAAPLVFVETQVLAEGLLLCLLLAALVLLSTPLMTPGRATVAGLLLGYATLVRPTAALIAAALIVALWRGLERGRRVVPATVLLGIIVVMGPAMLKNWVDSRTLTLQGFGGLNFYIGNSPFHTGLPAFRIGGGYDELNSAALRAGATDPAAQDRYYLRKTLAEIGAQPIAYVRLLVRKTLWLVQAHEVRDSHSFYFFAEESAILRWLPRMAILGPLALVGLWDLWRRRTVPPLLTSYAAAAALSVVLLVMGTRYRALIIPVFALWAGVAVTALIAASQRRDRRWLLIAGAVALVGIGVGHLLDDAGSRNVAEEWAMTGSSLVTEHRLSDAEAAYRRALAIDASSGLAWDGLGLALYDDQRWAEARDALTHAVELDPVNARVEYHIGLVDEHEHRVADAARRFEQATAIDPTNLDAFRHLATALLQMGQNDGAVKALDHVLAHVPNDSAAHRARADALGAAGRLAEAKKDLLAVTQLEPSNGDVWIDVCLISLDLGDLDGATAALARARTAGAPEARIQFANTALGAIRTRLGTHR